MTPEWLHVGLTVLLALMGGYQMYQNTNIKLAISKMETNVETKLGTIREWARETFVSKTDQMHLLEIVSRDGKNSKVG